VGLAITPVSIGSSVIVIIGRLVDKERGEKKKGKRGGKKRGKDGAFFQKFLQLQLEK